MEHHEIPEIPVFSGLNGRQIEELQGWLKRVEYKAGTQIYADGAVSDGMLVVSRGRLEVRKKGEHGPMVVAQIDAPTVIGEMGLLTEETRNADIYSITPVVAGLLPIELFEKKIEENNLTALRIAVNLGRIVSQRARHALDKLVLLARQTPGPERIKEPSPTETQALQALKRSHVDGGRHYDLSD
jgi:CRP-like cAMP-binding protein